MPRKKSLVTPPGIDPGTFRLVAQCLNYCATPGPYKNCKKKNFVLELLIMIQILILDTEYDIQYLHIVQIQIPNVQHWYTFAGSQVLASCWHVTNRSPTAWYLQFSMCYIYMVINYRLLITLCFYSIINFFNEAFHRSVNLIVWVTLWNYCRDIISTKSYLTIQ
jgi:hypothetical protein